MEVATSGEKINDQKEDIIIVGGGICGLATALALHRKGIKSVVLERSKTVRATGAAIIIQANGWRALDQLGVSSKLRHTTVPIQKMAQYIALDSGECKQVPLGDGEMRCLRRVDLMHALADDLPLNTIRFGCKMLY
ncbi:Monooxygenase 1 [Camellia lanceoleosa]|uniref:Monooxygenase 1 n=1 Tax=Camellia lanceoleosa TaxID=1840588 RepID=A0ACC0I9N4_9ERIC|nr:Monooxygenase 1 [Camellia lanceoleosa]